MKINDCVVVNVLSVAVILSMIGIPGVDASDMGLTENGRELYQDDCGGCHGASGHGDGTVAQALKIPPSDLTVLSKGNSGQFPEDYVRRAIDGRDLPPIAHGEIAMPIWGRHYRKSLVAYSEETVQRKLDALVAYLKSIQVE